MNPKVSIIIPVYNGEKFIGEAIDSALNQTYKNLEIIVVNDGSTDNTSKVVKSYGKKIKYYEKENGGVSTALNLGIEKMTGDYFSWLSHDDLYEPEKLETQINYLINHNLLGEKVILYSNYYLIDKNGKLLNNCIKDHNELNSKPEYALLRGAINGLSLLIPREAFEEHGVFDESMKCAQDYQLWHKMFSSYKPIHMPLTLVSSRYHANQVTNSSPRVISEGNKVWKMMIKDLSKADKERLEDSEYLFYYNMSEFLKTTPYGETQKYCENKAKEIRNKTKVKTADVLVSVIIPFYNRIEETLRAINSVLKQTHKNFEIILINDKSTEDIAPVRKIAEETKEITLIDLKENVGPAGARNEGIKIAKGEFVAFLDSDDEFLPKKIEKQLTEMLITNAVMSHTSYIRRMSGKETFVNSGIDNGDVRRKLIYSCQIATPTVMLKRSYIETHNLLFDSKLRIGEDICYWLSILKNKSLVGINEALTIVNTSDKNSAYDTEKQLIGTKSILKYLLTDEYYNIYDMEIANVAQSYANFANVNKPKSISTEIRFQQAKASIRTIGIMGTLKKIYNKIVR